MYSRNICQIDKLWLKGRLQECVINTETNDVVAVTSEDGDMAEKIAGFLNAEIKVNDLAQFVKRLSYKLKRVDENDQISNQAMAYLKENGLLGSAVDK